MLYPASSGTLYPALERLERRGLLHAEVLRPARGPARRVYRLTADGRHAHLAWVREPVMPQTVSQDLGMHLLRFVMMVDVLAEDEVARFLASLRAALAGFVAALEQVTASPDIGENPGCAAGRGTRPRGAQGQPGLDGAGDHHAGRAPFGCDWAR